PTCRDNFDRTASVLAGQPGPLEDLVISALVGLALAAPVTPLDRIPEPVRADVQLISGGLFSPDEIGPDRYQQVVDRVHADPWTYVDALQPPANIDALRDSTPDALLRLTEEALPGATRDAADRWLAADQIAYDRETDSEIRRRLASQAQTLSSVGA